MKLYYAPGACSMASHIVACEEGLPIGLEKVDLETHKTVRGEDYLRINPKGYVPALLLDDGTLLTENTAILPYLADARPSAGLAPPFGTLARAHLEEWLGYISSEIHRAFGPIFHGSEKESEKARKAIRRRLAYADEHLALRPFLLGEHFTVADAYLFVMLTWLDKARIDIEEFHELARYRDTIQGRAGVRKAMKQEGVN
jgi:glutathione S-transferase